MPPAALRQRSLARSRRWQSRYPPAAPPSAAAPRCSRQTPAAGRAYCGSIRNSEESVFTPRLQADKAQTGAQHGWRLTRDSRRYTPRASPPLTIAARRTSAGQPACRRRQRALYRRRAPARRRQTPAHRQVAVRINDLHSGQRQTFAKGELPQREGTGDEDRDAPGPAVADNAPPSAHGRPAHPGTPPLGRGAQRQFAALVNDHLHLPGAARSWLRVGGESVTPRIIIT